MSDIKNLRERCEDQLRSTSCYNRAMIEELAGYMVEQIQEEVKAELEGARANECQTNVLASVTPEQLERRRHLEGTPDETKLCYLYRGMVRVMGNPKEGDDHNCDEMGCGSCGDHVVMRFVAPSRPYEVTELRRELARLAEVDRKNMETIAAQAAELSRLRADHQELSDQFITNAQRLGSVCDSWHNWAVEIVGKEAARKMSGQDMRDEIARRLAGRTTDQAEPRKRRGPGPDGPPKAGDPQDADKDGDL